MKSHLRVRAPCNRVTSEVKTVLVQRAYASRITPFTGLYWYDAPSCGPCARSQEGCELGTVSTAAICVTRRSDQKDKRALPASRPQRDTKVLSVVCKGLTDCLLEEET